MKFIPVLVAQTKLLTYYGNPRVNMLKRSAVRDCFNYYEDICRDSVELIRSYFRPFYTKARISPKQSRVYRDRNRISWKQRWPKSRRIRWIAIRRSNASRCKVRILSIRKFEKRYRRAKGFLRELTGTEMTTWVGGGVSFGRETSEFAFDPLLRENAC